MSGSVSVVICAYDNERRELLRAALKSLFAQSRPALEILVVIDHNPRLKSWVETEFPDASTLANEDAQGLSGARNTGIRHASGSIIAFMDDDAVAGRDWIENILKHYDDPSVIGAGGLISPVWPKDRPAWFPEEFDWVVGCSYRGQPEQTAAVRNLLGCNMSFRREVFDRVGGFREGLGREQDNAAGCEETELCIRAADAYPNSWIAYDPSAIVHHRVASARTTWRYFRTRCLAEGRSKALIVERVGPRSGLASERRHVLHVLPDGMRRNLADTIRRRDIWGLARATAIVAGLAFVASSYLWAKLGRSRRSSDHERPFAPINVVDVDVSRPLPRLAARDRKSGTIFGGALCLVRQSGRPVDLVEIPLHGEDLSPAAFKKLLPAGQPKANGPRSDGRTPSRPPPPISVIVATRDRPASLESSLDSLLRQAYPRFDIVVVDNAPSSSATRDLVLGKYASSGRVRYLREDCPGLGLAHNRGVAATTSPILAFTDDDVVADPHWLAEIAAAFDGGEKVGCVTGLILPIQLETRAQYWTEQHGQFGKGFERRIFDLGPNRLTGKLFPYAAGRFGSGANMAFTRAALNDIGGFDPALGAGTPARGGDDLAAFVAIIRAGYQLVYEPGAIAWHRHRRDEAGMRRQAYGYGVGLGAYLTKCIFDKPTTLITYARAMPSAAVHLLSPSSEKNAHLAADYPRSFFWWERLGLLVGPAAYLRSRAVQRRPHISVDVAHFDADAPTSGDHAR